MTAGEIEFVYFDLGNMLVSFDPAIALGNVAGRFGVDPMKARDVLYESGLQDQFEHGQLTGHQFADAARIMFGLPESEMPTDDLLEAVSDMFSPIPVMESRWLVVGNDR